MHDVFKKLSKRYPNVVIELIGASDLQIEGVNLIQKKWNLETEVQNLQEFDIGVMPLSDDEWSRGKGGYKLLQYMAVGIPCIASPVGINREIIEDGINGFLAYDDEEWLGKLGLLIENKDVRHTLGMAGRKMAEEQYSTEVAFSKFVTVLQSVPMEKQSPLKNYVS